jgi:hypothetical protein
MSSWCFQVFLRSLLAIGVASCVMVLIIWPKIHRVLSGEKVVMSTYLGTEKTSSHASQSFVASPSPLSSLVGSSRREPAVSSAEGAAIIEESTESDAAAPKSASEELMRYSLKKDDPLPASVESKILRSESLLKGVTEKL